MIESQISLKKLDLKQLVYNFNPMMRPFCDEIFDFLSPFYHEIKQKNLKVNVIEAN